MNEICALMCVWGRLERLEKTLSQLNAQTFKNFDLYILNNNPQEKKYVEDLILQHKGSLNITLCHSEINLGPMVRFLKAKELDYSYAVILDDDEDFGITMMEVFNAEKEEKTLKAVVASDFKDDFTKRKRAYDGIAKYLGPGGMIADMSIFKMDEFWELWKPEYYVADDCWLSYFAQKIGWKTTVSKAPLFLSRSDENSMLRQKTIQDIKNNFVKNYEWTSSIKE